MGLKGIYEVLGADSKDELEEEVEKRLTEGWGLVGAPFVHGYRWFQAVVRMS